MGPTPMSIHTHDWRRETAAELDDFAHGAAGGFLFGIPLIYTMELWFLGLQFSVARILLLLALTILLSYTFVAAIGFRQAEPPRLRDVLAETIDTIGIALLVTLTALLVLGRIGPDTPLESALGRLTIELLPVSLGVAIANHILPRDGDRRQTDDERRGGSSRNPTLRDLVAAGGGALLLSLNIAPTDEVSMLASELSELQLVALIVVSLIVTYVIVFEAGFRNQEARRESEGLLQRPITETVVAYLISLCVCGAILWLFGAFDSDASLGGVLSRVVVLGLPGALGAAAGRLAV
jgi:putative integral membrane protein (TIGR02587 family)